VSSSPHSLRGIGPTQFSLRLFASHSVTPGVKLLQPVLGHKLNSVPYLPPCLSEWSPCFLPSYVPLRAVYSTIDNSSGVTGH